MRKFVVIFIAITCLSQLLVAQSGLRPRGDVNCDWEVTVSDINAVIDSIMSGAKYHSLYAYATDVNGDKEITIADVNAIISAILDHALPPMPTFSGTLPVMYINTEGHHNIDSKDDYIHADWWLDNMGIEGVASIGSATQPQGMQIKGRGNYTWTLNKKPYRIKLDKKQPLLGMKSNRHFCLLAHADDFFAKSMNEVGFELSRRIGLAYTPTQAPVEVVLNGQYIGLYFIADKVRVEKDRVNIEEQSDGETDSTLITGGWLLEIDNNTDENTIYINERNGGQHWYDWMWITSHSPEQLSQQQHDYVQQLLETASAAIYTPDKSSTEWEQYIDIDSLACFYIVNEILDDIESFTGSCYMHKHRGEDTKLVFGPVWDFGNAFHRRNYFPDLDGYHYFLYEEPCFFYNHWIAEIAKFPHFQEVVKAHWQDFYGSGFNGLDIDAFIDNHVATISQAWNSDSKRWKVNSIYGGANNFKRLIHEKVEWLQSQWGPQGEEPENGSR